MAMTSISVMMTVFVLNLHYRGPKKNEVPFWLQQLLSLSLVNTFRSFNHSRKFSMSCLPTKKTNPKDRSHDRNKPSPHRSTPSNGLLSSFTNINETQAKSRVTTDVSSKDVSSDTFQRELRSISISRENFVFFSSIGFIEDDLKEPN